MLDRMRKLYEDVIPTMAALKKSKCKRGHRLAGRNLYERANGYRECRECSLGRARRYLRKKAREAAA